MLRLRKMGWPESAVDWVKSFLHTRSARVRHEDGVTEPVFLECGLLQMSLLFPILFLYMAGVFRGSRWRFSYVDDFTILGIGSTPHEAAKAVQREVYAVLAWASGNTVSFEPEKTEVIYSLGPRARICDLPPIKVKAWEVHTSDEIRWLGVHVDCGLNFAGPVAQRASKEMRLVQFLRSLTRCIQVPRPDLITTVIRTVALSNIMYATELWW